MISTLPINKIRVVVRFRPHNAMEEKSNAVEDVHSKTLSIINDTTIQAESLLFGFDDVLTPKTSQNDAFKSIAHILCNDVLNGFNSTIFVYGQTGSGKTYTMYGDENGNKEANIDKMGIIPRSISCIFERLELEKADGSIIEYSMKVSFVEIYNEHLRDLLVDRKQKRVPLKVRMNHAMRTYVAGLQWVPVSNIHEVLLLIHLANQRRTVSATRMNAVSSRGHLLARFSLTKKFRSNNTVITQVSDAHFGDLAGSEKMRKTGATGRRLTEANHINTSLTVLGRVITALTSKKKRVAPYRDSVLTHILKDSLGGNCKTTLVVTGSTHIYNRDETINSLKFGQRCKMIQSKSAKVNRVYTQNELLTRMSMLELDNAKLRARGASQNEELALQNSGLQFEIIKLGQTNERTHIETEELKQQVDELKNQLEQSGIHNDDDDEVNEDEMDYAKSKKVIQDKLINSAQEALILSDQKSETLRNQMVILQHEIDDLKFAHNVEKNKVENAENALGLKLEDLQQSDYLCEEIRVVIQSIKSNQTSVEAIELSDSTQRSIVDQAADLKEFAAQRLSKMLKNGMTEEELLSKTI